MPCVEQKVSYLRLPIPFSIFYLLFCLVPTPGSLAQSIPSVHYLKQSDKCGTRCPFNGLTSFLLCPHIEKNSKHLTDGEGNGE